MVIFIVLAFLAGAILLFIRIRRKPVPEVKSVSVGQLENLAQKIAQEKDTFLLKSKTVLDQQVKNNADNLIKIVDTTLGGSVESSSPDAIVIDFSSGKKVQLVLQKGKNYSLQFLHFPADLCVFANRQWYKISDGQLVQVQFSQSGTFPLTVDYCDQNRKNLGQVVVN